MFSDRRYTNLAVDPIALEIDPPAGSPEPDPPISLDLARQHCAADEGNELDDLLELYIQAAVSWAEGAMHRAILARTHRWILRGFPRTVDQTIRLPRGRTQAIESIAYTSNGVVSTLTGPTSSTPGTGYQEDLRGDSGGRLMPLRGETWPSVDCDVVSPVVITFTAGWTVADDVPADIKHAMLFAVSDALELRGTADLVTAGRNFETRELLISGWRLPRMY